MISSTEAVQDRGAPPVPMHVFVPCPGCGAVDEITLVVDETLLPAIPVRAETLPTRCPELGVLLDAEDQAEVAQRVNEIIARVGQHMLAYHGAGALLPPRAPLSIFNVRRTLKAAFGDACTIPANSRPTRHREEDR